MPAGGIRHPLPGAARDTHPAPPEAGERTSAGWRVLRSTSTHLWNSCRTIPHMPAHQDPAMVKVMTGGAAVLWSVLLGVICGVVAEPFVHQHFVNQDVWGRGGPGGPFEPEHLLTAAFIGLFAALMISPVHLVALRGRPRNACLGIVYGSTVVVTLTTAAIAHLACIPFAVITSIGSAVFAAKALPNFAAAPGVCRWCRYQVKELPVCPECGNAP
jgi:hypothetical protein